MLQGASLRTAGFLRQVVCKACACLLHMHSVRRLILLHCAGCRRYTVVLQNAVHNIDLVEMLMGREDGGKELCLSVWRVIDA